MGQGTSQQGVGEWCRAEKCFFTEHASGMKEGSFSKNLNLGLWLWEVRSP